MRLRQAEGATMKAVKFPEANKVLVHPKSMTEEECRDLHVLQTEDGRLISCWELDGDELMKILETKRIWLHVWSGDTQPPVSLDVEEPFEEEESDEATEASNTSSD